MSDTVLEAPIATLVPLTKRIVLRHSSGLHQILGAIDTQPREFIAADEGVLIDGKPEAINLVAAKPRYYLYTVVRAPERLDSFHQQQR